MARCDSIQKALWPIERLRPHPSQERLFTDTLESELQDLKVDIEQHGLRRPLEVLPDGTIVCGHRRLRVLRMLHYREVPVLVLRSLAAQGDAAVQQRLIADNLLRRQLTPLGKVRCYLGLMQGLAASRKPRVTDTHPRADVREHLVRILNQSGRNVDRYLAVARLPMPIQQAFDDGQLSLVEAARVATLRREAQDQIAAAIKDGMAAREAVAGHLPSAPHRHKEAASALAAFILALKRGVADLEGRIDSNRTLPGDEGNVLQQAKRLIDQLLSET